MPMTLEEAFNKVANDSGWSNWRELIENESKGTIEVIKNDAIELYAHAKWDEALNTILSNMEAGFLNNVKEVDNPEHKIVFQAIGETIKNYPKPEFKP